MYQSRQRTIDLVTGGDDERRKKEEGAGGEQPSTKRGDPAAGVLADAFAYAFNREVSAMLSRLSAAMAELPPGSAAREHIVAAMHAAERAGQLNRQLLAHAGSERAKTDPLDLNALIREKVQLLEIDRASNLTLRLELAPSLPAVEGDPEQVQHAVSHLLTNAAEAIGSGAGMITAVTSTAKVTSTANVTSTAAAVKGVQGARRPAADRFPAPGRYVTLEITDDGCGMDEETQERMFAPFFSTKGVGRGLGMTAVLGAVRGHGGGIEVKSRPGEGTTVTLFFPVADDGPSDEPSPSNGVMREGDDEDGRRCVLVIDDELDVREAVADIMAVKGLDVLTAADGKSGLQLFREHGDEVDLVLLDLSMPKMGGEETCRRLRGLDPDVRILITSGYEGGQASGSLDDLQADGFLPKPYDMKGLMNAIFDLLGEGVSAGVAHGPGSQRVST